MAGQDISAYLRSRFPTGRIWRWASVIAVVCHVTVLAPQQTFAQDARVTFSFLRPGGSELQAPLFSFEMLDTVALGDLTLPAVKFISTDSGTKVTDYTIALPALSLAGLSVTPQYGEQKLGLMASSLSGLKLRSQKVNGFSLSTKRGSNAFTLMLGQLAGRKTKLVGAPSMLAFTGTLKPSARLTFAPRVVTPLGSQTRPGSAGTSVGTGVTAAVSSHVKLIGEFAGAQTKQGSWAPFAVVGSVGKWSRGSVETSLRRANSAYALAGRIPSATQDQEMLKGQLRVIAGLSVTGELSTSRPHAKQQDDAGRVTRSLSFKVARFGPGTFKVTRKLVTDHSRDRRTDKWQLEWRQKHLGESVVRLTQERQRDLLSDGDGRLTRQLQFEYEGSSSERVSLSGRTSFFLSQLAANRSRVRSRLKGRVAVGGGLALSGEAEYDLFGNRAAMASIGKVRLGGDVSLSDRTTLHLVYSRDPKARTARSQRIEGRISRLVSF